MDCRTGRKEGIVKNSWKNDEEEGGRNSLHYETLKGKTSRRRTKVGGPDLV